MSWSEGRGVPASIGATISDDRKKALERVDGVLQGLARDKLLQEDLRHPDVRRALEHWTGRDRLSKDEADELMEDNFRIQSVCSKMVELQGCCKLAGIGLPLPHVLAGKGLHDQVDDGRSSSGGNAANTSLTGGDTGPRSGTFSDGSGSSGGGGVIGSSGSRQRTPGPAQSSEKFETATAAGNQAAGDQAAGDQAAMNSAKSRQGRRVVSGDVSSELPSSSAAAAEAQNKGGAQPSWRRTLAEELVKILVVFICALAFTAALKYYRGEDPLGGLHKNGGGGMGSAAAPNEL